MHRCEAPVPPQALALRSRWSPQDGRCLNNAHDQWSGLKVCSSHKRFLTRTQRVRIYCGGDYVHAVSIADMWICSHCGKPVKVVT